MKRIYKKSIALLLTLLMVCSLLPTVALAADPPIEGGAYVLTTADHLVWFAGQVNGGQTTINAVLGGDIDLSGLTAWTPIGTSSNKYAGTFDGQNHAITGLTAAPTATYSGIFSYANGATIQDLSVTVNYTVPRKKYGAALLGQSEGDTVIRNVTANGSITTDGSAFGGIVGSLKSGTVTGCTNNVSLNSSRANVGGIVGAASGGSIENCVNNGSVTASGTNYNAGGILGSLSGAVTVTNCENTGNVTASYNVGGIVGNMSGNGPGGISGCENTGTITSTDNSGVYDTGGAGGIVGGVSVASGLIEYCQNSGTVTGSTSCLGGIASDISSAVALQNCYNTGAITSTGAETSYASGIVSTLGASGTVKNCYNTGAVSNGVCANNAGTITNSFYLDSASANAGSGTSKTDGEMKGAAFAALLGSAWQANNGAYPTLAYSPATTAPTLMADASKNFVDEEMVLSFIPNSAWQSAVTAVQVNGTPITDYTLASNSLTIPGSHFPAKGDYTVTVIATGYNDTSVVQKAIAPSTLTLGSGEAVAGGMVTIPVTMENNVDGGFKKLLINTRSFSSPSYFTLNGVALGSALADNDKLEIVKSTYSQFYIQTTDDSLISTGGEIAKVTFSVSASATNGTENDISFNSVFMYDAAGTQISGSTNSAVFPLVTTAGVITINNDKSFTVTPESAENGTLNLSVNSATAVQTATSAKLGDSIQVTGTGDTGYTLTKVEYSTDGGTTYTEATMTSGAATISMPGTDTLIRGTFSIAYNITVDATKCTNGTVSYTGTAMLAGKPVQLTCTPNEGYGIGTLYYQVEGGEVQNGGRTNWLTVPEGDVTVWMEFAKEHTITIQPSENGTVTERTGQTVCLTGRDVDIIATPNENCFTEKVEYSADGGTTWTEVESAKMGALIYYRFEMPDADVLARAVIKAYPTVTVAPTTNGSVTSPVATGAPGTAIWLTVAPEEGYRCSALYYETADSTQTPIRDFFSFNLPNESITIHATFVPEDQVDETITTKAQLEEIRDKVNSGEDDYFGKLIKLGNDIDLGGENWTPIGTSSTAAFCGSFDGDGHTISGLSITSVAEGNDYVGLFGYAKYGKLANLNVSGAIDVDAVHVGSIAGGSQTETFENCRNFATIENGKEAAYAGGIVSYITEGTVIGCSNYGTISAPNNGNVSGIVAYSSYARNTTVTNCVNYAALSADQQVAGIVACGDKLAITGCANKGTLTAVGLNRNSYVVVGGIMGYITGDGTTTITDCYNTADLNAGTGATKRSGEPYVGGIAASMQQNAQPNASVTITNCYNTGTLTKTGQFTSTTSRYGEIAPTVYLAGSDYAGWREQTFAADKLSMTNCHTKAEMGAMASPEAAASALGAGYQADVNAINTGSTPLLTWESNTPDTTKRTATFLVSGATNYTVTVYTDDTKTETVPAEQDGTFMLQDGSYPYVVSAANCRPASGTITVFGCNLTERVALTAAHTVTFKLTPAAATLTLTNDQGVTITPESSSNGTVVYLLDKDALYNYTVTASQYLTASGSFRALATETRKVSLSTAPAASNYVNGGDTITQGGTYYIESNATGIITVSTTQPVTLIGAGIVSTYENLFIDCTQPGTNLTLKNVGIEDTTNTANLLDFNGAGNTLNIEGVCLLNYDIGYTDNNDALIHVPNDAELTICGAGTLYQYNQTQGAGIGGDTGEMNGDITFNMTGSAFIKGTKQGAVIGAGANASGAGTPGSIRFVSGTYNLISNSRGSVIGGSAGSEGASEGTTAYIEKDASVNINVDYSGSAVGGGGYSTGNDASGGSLYISGGSLRVYVDTNAANNTTGWQGLPIAEGLNDAAVTAQRLNGSNEPVYRCVLNTSGVSGSSFTVKADGTEIYSGGLHGYGYVQETLDKETGEQLTITSTMSNWYPITDTNLYLYLTGEDHTLTVNGKTFNATWDDSTKTFAIKDAQGNPVSAGGSTGGTTPAATNDITVTDTEIPATIQTGADGSVTANAAPSQSAVNKAVADAVKAADDADTKAGVELKATGDEEADETTLTIPTQSVKDMAGNSKVAELIVTANNGSVTFDETALNSLASQASGSSIVVDVKSATEEDAKEAIAAANGLSENDVDLANSIVVDVTVSSNGKPITDYSGKLTVGVPVDGEKFAEGDSYKVVVIHSDKSVETLTGKCVKVDGKLVVQVTVKKLSTFIVSGDKAVSFTDVALNAWFYDAVAYCKDEGLMDGIGNNLFNPNGTLTRAMMVTVLYRLAGEPAVAEAATFTDVPTGQWYSDAIAWAEDNKIVDGYGNGVFGPNDNITREQMATILLRYSDSKGYDLSKASDLAAYTDAAEISSWALSSMKWANAEGLITGRTATTLVPGGTANRAEVATILMRFCENIIK